MSPKAIGLIKSAETVDLRKLKGLDRKSIQIGRYYNKLNYEDRTRFNRLSYQLEYKLEILPKFNPIEMILIRFVVMSTLQSEKIYQRILEHPEDEQVVEWEKRFYAAANNAIGTIKVLLTYTKTTKKVKKVDLFQEMRGGLRKEEGLKPSKKASYLPDGHDRRYHRDGVTRTEQEKEKDK